MKENWYFGEDTYEYFETLDDGTNRYRCFNGSFNQYVDILPNGIFRFFDDNIEGESNGSSGR